MKSFLCFVEKYFEMFTRSKQYVKIQRFAMLVISICIVGLTFYPDPTKEHTRMALIYFKSIWHDRKVKKKDKKNGRFV